MRAGSVPGAAPSHPHRARRHRLELGPLRLWSKHRKHSARLPLADHRRRDRLTPHRNRLLVRANLIATRDLPSPAYYNAFSIASDSRNEGKIALELAESWHRYTVDEQRVARRKSMWLDRGVVFMGVGLLAFAALAVDALLAARAVPAAAPVVH